MAVAGTRWNAWVPLIAAGAAAAYAFRRTYSHHAGPAVRADYGSDTRRKLGGASGIHVQEAVTIDKPATELYRFWRDFENLPKFMSHLESVAVREAGISHWVARGPGGMRVEWDARVINDIDNKLIGWQSLEGSMISTAGSVHFDETPRGTSVMVHLQYNPPGGKLAGAIAWLFGEEPRIQVRDDLRRLKQFFETGEVPTTQGQPSGGRGMLRDAISRFRGRDNRVRRSA